MNADPHVHHAYALAESLNYASPDHPALDAVILLHTYSDDEAYIGGDIQSYQVEQILYTLLLISLESLSGSEQSVLGDQDLIPYTSEDAYTYQMPLLPWPIFMIGISSLEYSARWAGRWLDYGLVATIIDVMRAAEEVDAEDILDDLRKDVREKFDKWLQKVRRIVCEELIEAVANLQVFKELEYTLATSPFHGKKGSDSEHELGVFCQNIRRLYLNTGYGSTLESSMKSAELIPRQLERASMRMVQSQGDEEKVSLTYNLYQQLHELQSEVAKLPALLFQYVRGMLPRVSRQLSALVEMVNEVRETAESAPDLRKCLEQFNRVAERELLQLQRATNDQRWPFSGQITQLRKDSYSKLKDLVRDHMLQTRDVIVARIALVLLEKAGFYNSKGKEGKIDLFREKVRTIDSALKEAQKRAQLQKQRAYKRLNVSLSQTQVGISQTPLRLSLNNRRDRLDWTQVVESFEIHSKRLDESPHLELLMRWLLRLLGGEKPLDITQQYLNDLKTADPGAFRTDEQKQHELHAYSSMLVAVLILFATVGFDIVSIQNLLDKYTHLKRSAFDEPLTLETDIIGLQSIIREAKATRNAIGNKSQKQIFSGLASLQGRTLEIIIAAWVHNLYSEDPQLTQVLAQRGILARLEENQISPVQAIKDLQARNRLLGYRDDAAGSDLYYLLLAPGEASKDFLKEAAHIHFVHIQSIRFPDPEKLIYLHVHRVRQGFPGFIPPP
jgi:hypothetical protein